MRLSADFKREVLRKALHVAFSSALLLPFNEQFASLLKATWGLGPTEYYAIIAVSLAAVNAAQVRRPLIREEILRVMRAGRRKIMDEIKELFLSRTAPGVRLASMLDRLDEALTNLETTFSSQIDMLERSYERVSGYIGVTFGVVSVLASYVLFRGSALYGVLALMVVDPVAALATRALPSRLMPASRTSVAGAALSALAYALALTALGLDPARVAALALVASMAEAYGVEDNISIPVLTSLSAFLLGA